MGYDMLDKDLSMIGTGDMDDLDTDMDEMDIEDDAEGFAMDGFEL